MDLRDRTAMILGGSGLVGHAVARRLLAAEPKRVVLVALYEDEVRRTAEALAPYRGRTTVDVEWGNVFLPAAEARLERGAVLANPTHRAALLRDLLGDLTDEVLGRSLLAQLLLKYRPDAVVDSINTATAFAYQDIFQSARDLLAAAADGRADRSAVEAHVLTLTMPQLIRHVQILHEALRRAGTRAYVKIGTSGTGGMGLNIPYTHSEERPSRTLLTKSAVGGAHSLLLFLLGRTPGAPATIEIKPTATIAWRDVMMELEGRPTGKDIVAALDGATAGPTYRAGILRRHALDRLRELERSSGERSVAFEMLGPPRLTKLLFEAYLCGRLRPSVRALATSAAAALAEESHALVRADATLRQRILSVGIPILAPDGVRLYRGAHVVVPPAAGDPCVAAPRGWVDLRPDALGQWIRRAQVIVAQAEQRQALTQESGSDVAWTAPGADDPVSPARLATWVFAVEDQGERIKR